MFEKKRGTRFLASVMALVMLLSLAPVGALATEDEGQPAENQAVAQSAVVDEDKNTPTEPTKDSDSAEATKSEGGLDESYSNADTSSNDNGIAVQNFSDGRAAEEQPITAEYWVTNDNVVSGGEQTMTIRSTDSGIKSDDGVSVKLLAPETGKWSDHDVIFWQARVLSASQKQVAYGKKQTKAGNEATAFRYKNGTWQYKDTNEEWADINVGGWNPDQVVFYYTVVTNLFNDMIQINITDWPRTDGGDNTVTYEVYVDDENNPTNQIITYYNTQNWSVQGRTTVFVDNVSVDMNQLEKYKVRKIERQYANQNAEELSVNDSRSNFSIDLDNGNCTIKIYLERYKYVLSYELNEGSIASGTTYTLAGSYEEDETITAPASESMSRAGYTFDGWYMDDALENPWTGDKMPSKDFTLYAKWNKNSYTVTYKDGDTSLDNLSEKVVYGTDVTVKSYSKKGYTLTGWVDGDNKSYSVNDTFSMPDKDVTLTAVWKDNTTSPTDPDTDLVDAMYFVLMPGQGVPKTGVNQGVDKYFPNASNNGGVKDRNNTNGYVGKITEAATKLKGAQTTKGYFQVNGVDPDGEYLKKIGDLGYFNAANYNADGTYKGTLPTGMANFNMTKKSIVWYVIKKEGNGYHVDGYVKGVPITLTYHENFGTSNAEKIINQNINGTVLNSGDKVRIQGYSQVFSDAANQHQGWSFEGWFTKNGQEYKQEETTLIDSVDLYARWTKSYDVVTHFMDANGDQKAERTKSNLSGVHGTLLKDMVLPLNQVNTDGITGNYVYVPSETKYSVGNENRGLVGNATFTEANTVIHQYYYLDETGNLGEDEKGNPTDKKDGIPDAWQYKVTFKVVNGKWNDDSSDNIVVYVNAKDKDGKTLESKLTEAQIPAVGEKPNSGYRASGSWDKSLSADLKITGDTEFTFTYSRRSSGGSSRPSTPPTVDIPDDVPTGLNGKDHYAYIIGYGNNDVRPQNNITRAEVATIFFRLLTDETREANMTKSNGYNDVKDGDWFCCAVSTLSKMGIIKGYEDGSFKPNDPISRAEFAAIAARFDPDGDKTPATFADVTSHWAKDEISIAANHGWIKGYEDGSFKPDQKITRAETMTLVNRVLNRLPETKDDLHKDMKTWVDNMDETAWYYLAVQEATNSHYFKNKTGTKFEQWTDLRDTRDWSELEK